LVSTVLISGWKDNVIDCGSSPVRSADILWIWRDIEQHSKRKGACLFIVELSI